MFQALYNKSKSKYKTPSNESSEKKSSNTSAPPQRQPSHQPGGTDHSPNSSYNKASGSKQQSDGNMQRRVTGPPTRQAAERARGRTASNFPYNDGCHGTFAQSGEPAISASAPNALSSRKPIPRKPVPPPHKSTPLAKSQPPPPSLPPRPVSPLTASDMTGETMPVSPILPAPDYPHRWVQ